MVQIALAIPQSSLGSRAVARTKEIERCLKLEPDLIWMMDADQTMPSEALELVLNIAKAKVADIYVVDAPTRHDESSSNIRYHPNGELAYFTISCCFICPQVFHKLSTPWFSSEYAWVEEQPKDGLITWRIDKKYSDDNVGEDIYFSRKCLSAGLTIKLLPYKCRHVDLS